MKKKLLAGILALALCSTNMPPQTIFAGEFTSGNPDIVSEEETPEIFTNEEQEAAGETEEELSVFSSEELPEFDDAPDEAVAATENAQNGVIDLTDATKVTDGVYTITSIGDHRFTCSNEQTTTNRIVVDGTNTSEQDNINIYLDNVNIKTSVGPALQINNNVEATVTIYLTGKNKLTTTNQNSAGLEKNNTAHLTIDNSKNNTGELIAKGSDYGAGIGGGFGEHSGGKCMNITIRGGSVEAYSLNGAGIGGGFGKYFGGDCSNITISGGSVNAHSDYGAGIGGGSGKVYGGGFGNSNGGNCNTIIINGGLVKAHSSNGAGIGGGFGEHSGGKCMNITISGGSVDADAVYGAGIGGGPGNNYGGDCNTIIINGGLVKAYSSNGVGIGGGSGKSYGGACNTIIINNGSVEAHSTNGADIGGGNGEYFGGNCMNITISGGSVEANGVGISGGRAQKFRSDCSNITISGGSVNAQVGCTPHKKLDSSGSYDPKSPEVYLCVIPNRGTQLVTIDDNSWKPSNHKAVGSGNTNLYAWLTGEDHFVTVGSEDRCYIFKSDTFTFNQQGKHTITNNDFNFNPPTNLTYDGNTKTVTVSPKVSFKDMAKNITVKYFLEDKLINGLPVNAGTYTVKINVKEGEFYNSIDNLTDDNWKFTIEPAPITSDIQITSYSGTYDGGPHAVIYSVTGCPKGCTIEYSTDRKTWTDKCPTVKSVEDATNTSVYIQISKENYTTLTLGPQKASISPKDITINIDNLEKTYGTANPALTFKVSDQTPLVANDTIKSLGIKLKTTAETSSPVNSSGYPITLESWTNKNYNVTVNQEGALKVKPAAKAPNLPSDIDTKISVSWFCKKVGDITNILPEHWIWKDTDKSKELKVEEPISADAVYNGTDKENYVTKTVTYTITRSKCEHKHTAGRYYSSPSCTSSGYSGDTYCTDCNETLSYGYTIPAYGHDYDNGVITTEPTAETDGIITYTCKRCKHQDTKTLGKLGDGEPYIEGSFQKKGWDAVNDLIKASKEKDTISIILNGSRTLPASVLSGIKGKDISLNLDMENGFIWKINGTSITAETPADTDLSVTNTAEYIPAALYSLISTNQNDFGFHLGRNGAFDFPAVLSVKADASCAGLMANLFWYDVENGVLQCIQTVTVGGAFEDSIPYADFTLSKGQDYFIAFGTESLNGRVIHTDGSITDENGAYLRPADTKISSHSIDRNKLTVRLSKGCAGAQGYDFVISKKSDMLKTGKFSKTVSSTGKPQASFKYLSKGTWYVAARSWALDAQGNKVYGSWTKIKKIKITVVTPQQPKIRDITVKGNTVTITYTKCKNATGYEILLGTKYKTSAGEKYPVKKYVKRTEGKNTVTVTFTNIKKGTWYVTVRSWNKTSKDKSRVYSPYSAMKKFKTKK